MNSETTIDWECWEVEEPPADFAERVMGAVLAETRPSAMVRRSKRPARWTGILAATAVAAGSFSVLAMIAERALRHPPPSETRQAPSEGAPGSASALAVTAASTPRPGPAEDEPAPSTVVDRKRRDAVRARLVPLLEGKGVERDPHTGLTIPGGSSDASHNLSKEYLRARMREDFYPLARACYESALAKQPDLRGQIVIDFVIVGDAKVGGIVDQAAINDRTDITDAEFTQCIRESMLSMVFAPPDNNGWVTVTYPILFAPDDEGQALRDR